MVFKLNVHAEMTLKQLATAIADTIPNERIVKAADNFQEGKLPFNPAYPGGNSWDGALWQMVGDHLIEHQFMPIKTILIIMVNGLVDYYIQYCPSESIEDLSYMVGDGEISKSYGLLLGEIKCLMSVRYNTSESVNAIREEAS